MAHIRSICLSLIAAVMLSACGGDVVAIFNFSPDADPETTTVDGLVYRQDGGGTTWADLHDGAGTWVDDSGDYSYAWVSVNDSGASDYNSIKRGVLLFDTSSLHDAHRIVEATLRLYMDQLYEDFAQSIVVVSHDTTANTSLALGDYIYTKFGTTDYSERVAVSAMSAAQYVDFELNAAGIAAISKTGVTKFGVRTTDDVDDSAPASPGGVAIGGVKFNTSDEGSNPPLLFIRTSTDCPMSSD